MLIKVGSKGGSVVGYSGESREAMRIKQILQIVF